MTELRVRAIRRIGEFGSGLADPRVQNHRNSELFRGQFYKIGCE